MFPLNFGIGAQKLMVLFGKFNNNIFCRTSCYIWSYIGCLVGKRLHEIWQIFDNYLSLKLSPKLFRIGSKK